MAAIRTLSFSILLLCLCAGLQARGEISVTNRPFPGILIHSETRTNPPTRLFVAQIDLTNPKLRLRVARGGVDPDGDGPWQTTLMQPTRIAAREHYDLVVNGDFFRARGVKDAEGTNSAFRSSIWSAVIGPAASAGTIWAVSTNRRPCLVVSKDGKIAIKRLAQPGKEDWEVLSGNVMLVQDGKAVAHDNKLRHPRTVAGLDSRRTRLVLMVVDGRKPGVAVGMNYDELAAEMIRLGCADAFNLDGGGSSVMAVRDAGAETFSILNQPTDGRERAVANVLGVIVDEK